MRRRVTDKYKINQVKETREQREQEYLRSIGRETKPVTNQTSVIGHVYMMSFPPASIQSDERWKRFEVFVVSRNLLVVFPNGWLSVGCADIRGKIMPGQKYYSGDRYRTRFEWETPGLDWFIRFQVGWERLCAEFVNQGGTTLYGGAMIYCKTLEHANLLADMIEPLTTVSSYLY